MTPTTPKRNPVEVLADEFVARFRAGERPALTEFVTRAPEHESEIRELFPTLVFMEQLRPNSAEQSVVKAVAPSIPTLTRLGDFRIVREIGRGGMGVVYEAVQESLGRHVALKTLTSMSRADSRHVKRFEREARAAAQLHHTNIVPVFGVGLDQGIHFYAMQFIQGQGLDEVLREVRRLRALNDDAVATSQELADPLTRSMAYVLMSATIQLTPENESSRLPMSHASVDETPTDTDIIELRAPRIEESDIETDAANSVHDASASLSTGGAYYRNVARIGMEAAEALAYAHSRGVLHRDIKPSNLLLDLRGTTWVTDFGLAKLESGDNLTVEGDLVGTLRYMAPERFRNRGDARSDVYGLGLTLYELLALRPAFDAVDQAQLIKDVSTSVPPAINQIDPLVPRDLQTIVHKAIAADAELRYQTAAELGEDLRRFLGDQPILARRSSALERGWRWCRRNPVMATLSVSVVSLLILVAVLSSVSAGRLRGLLTRAENAELSAIQRLEEVKQADRERSRQLFDSLVAQSQARRSSRRMGQRFESLAAIQQAADLAKTLSLGPDRLRELRNEAIAAMLLVDLREDRQWPSLTQRDEIGTAFDADVEHYARFDPGKFITIRRMSDDHEVLRITDVTLPKTNLLDENIKLRFSPNGRYLSATSVRAPNQVWQLTRTPSSLAADLIADQSAGAEGQAIAAKKVLEVTAAAATALFASGVFSADSRLVAFADTNGAISVFDLSTGQRVKQIKVGTSIGMIEFHPLRSELAVAHGNEVVIVDAGSGRSLNTLVQDSSAMSMAWNHDGSLLAVGRSDATVAVWDMSSKTPSRIATCTGHRGTVINVAFNQRGDLLASTSWDSTTRLWEPLTGQQLVVAMGHAASFSRDDRWLAFGRFGSRLGRWEVANRNECREFLGTHRTWGISSPVVSADGRLLAFSQGYDRSGTDLQLFDIASGQKVARLPTGRIVWSAFHPNGNSLIVSGHQGVFRWPIRIKSDDKHDAPASDREASIKHDVPVGDRASASANNNVPTYEFGPPQDLQFPLEQHLESYGQLSPDGRWLAVLGAGKTFVRDLHNLDAPLRMIKHGDNQTPLMGLSPDGRYVATSAWHGHDMKVWDTASGQRVHVFPGRRQNPTFAPDGKTLLVGTAESDTLHEIGSWQPLPNRNFPRENAGVSPGPADFSNDQQLLAICSSLVSTKLIAPSTGEEIATLLNRDDELVEALSFSPDGQQLALSLRSTGRVRVWNLSSVRQTLERLGLTWNHVPSGEHSRTPTVRIEVQVITSPD